MKKQKKMTKWHKLDNTANMFPVVATKRMTNVFRITCVTKNKIEPQLLQQAVDETLPFFRAFCVRLRHGLFWSYFETNDAPVKIEEEREAPCRYIDPVNTNRYLFRVLYYKNRVHLEVFHALTDGTGAIRFLNAIVYAYLKLRFAENFSSEILSSVHGTEGAANIEDAYIKNYVPQKSKSYKEPTAFRFKGEFRAPDNIGVLTALMPIEQLKPVCKKYNASITEYLTALLAFGIYKEYRGTKGFTRPVNMFVLVDLRRIFNSDTSLNFFSNIVVSLVFSDKTHTFESVLQEVQTTFKELINREYFEQKLSYTVSSETSFINRIVPLPVKNGILRIIYESSNHGSTMPFSNLGVQDPEPEFAPYIEGYRLLLYACEHDAVKCGAVSSMGVLALNFTTYLEGFALAKFVVRTLAAEGVEIEVESNGDSDELL